MHPRLYTMLPLAILTALLIADTAICSSIDNAPQVVLSDESSAVIIFGEEWSVLGPFQVGTREAPWGADPLEYFGGFPNLQYDNVATFKSSLTPNGTLKWSSTRVPSVQTAHGGSKASLRVSFSHVDWAFLQAVYGWSALQWQGWARGEFVVHSEMPISAVLYTDHVLEFALDGERHFGGDFFGFRKSPLSVHLAPGKHILDVRLVRDVRSMGGVSEPTVDVDIEIALLREDVEAVQETILLSDVVGGVLLSPYASVDVRNSGEDWVELFRLAIVQSTPSSLIASLHHGLATSIAPGQTRPVIFLLQLGDGARILEPEIDLVISYRLRQDPHQIQHLKVPVKLHHKLQTQPHKLTHLHPGGVVSYSILRSPSEEATCYNHDGLAKAPVMLQLHGAGVETDSDMVYDVIDSLPDLCAWVLFPSGVTPWSGDDWHIWGFADVLASITGIPTWIEATGWQGVGLDSEKWFVGGHSNGGQGTWYALLHYPDNVIAASPLSGYLSIQEYVPYKFWRSAEPKKRAIVNAALNSYRSEYLAPNAKGIPILQQHGGADANVPAYHSRLMSELLAESGWTSGYDEVAGMPHWWDGVVVTDTLSKFYKEQIAKAHEKRGVPSTFELVVANVADTGSKFGLMVLRLTVLGEFGRVIATLNESTKQWALTTRNVEAFSWSKKEVMNSIEVDRDIVRIEMDPDDGSRDTIEFWKDKLGHWTTAKPKDKSHRQARLGGLDAILRTHGAFTIVYNDNEAFRTALQVARNLHQYYYADAQIVEDVAEASFASYAGNRINISIVEQFPNHLCMSDFPQSVCPSDLPSGGKSIVPVLRWPHRSAKPLTMSLRQSEYGAIFLRPVHSRLELVILASNPAMLGQISRLVPTITGVGQPDWIICDESAAWKGVDGCEVGFFGMA